MRFVHEGLEYVIDFSRQSKKVRVGVDIAGHDIMRDSIYPSTTVTIYVNKPGHLPGEVFRTATVGCHWQERYSLEKGRINALRQVSRTLDKPFKTKVWEAYMGRKNRQSEQAVVGK